MSHLTRPAANGRGRPPGRYGVSVRPRIPIRPIAILIGWILAAFALFSISVALFGSWWRFDRMPMAEEWSAFFGASALIALGFAWYQIRQVDHSNTALITSNELSRQVNLESIRPRVQVYLQAERFVAKKRGMPSQGTVYLAVTNTGVSRALNVRLTVDPPFGSLPEFFKPGMMGQHLEEMNAAFDGDVRFSNINPGASYIWFLGRSPEIFDDVNKAPRRYEITAAYDAPGGQPSYRDEFVIDLDVEKRIERPVDPLLRIGKDIEVVGDHLGAIRKAMPRREESNSVDFEVPRRRLLGSRARIAARTLRRRTH